MTKIEHQTLEEINKAIAYNEDLKERVCTQAQNEDDREYRADCYARVDRINAHLNTLYRARNSFSERLVK